MEFNLAQVHEAVERAAPARECIVFRERRLSYRDVGDRSRQIANALLQAGLGRVVPRSQLAPHQSGQDHLAICLHNGNEYLETMLGAFKARVVPFNVNYRYVAEELAYLLRDASARGVVYHSAFAPVMGEVLDSLPELRVRWQVPDDSGNGLLDGSRWYDDALDGQPTVLADDTVASWSPDDLYLLYTGGTTGKPKGVMWRQADIFVAALGGRRLDNDREWDSLEQIAASSRAGGARLLPAAPLMHGAAHWLAFNGFTNANTIVLSDVVDHLDPRDILGVVEREAVEVLLIVGDAFGRPIVEALERDGRGAGSLLIVVNGGAALSPGMKERLLAQIPTAMIADGLGSSETGQQASQLSTAGRPATTGRFRPDADVRVLHDDMTSVLEPGHDGIGWLAQTGRVPMAYLDDPDTSARTFPTIDGTRYSVPGDRARVHADGQLELLGRESSTINSGGEKIFAEEVEQALLHHRCVADCLVTGRPSQRWGEEVVAVVQLFDDQPTTDADLLEEAARHVARYKLPKAVVRVPEVRRGPAGKADYRWAAEMAARVAAQAATHS